MENSKNIDLATAVWLANDDYDYNPNTISVTTLMRSIRQIVLSKRATSLNMVKGDVEQLIQSRMGSAIHDSIERVWCDPVKVENSLRKLGYDENHIKKVRINPDLPEEGCFNVFVEQRMFKEIDGYTLSGKFDIVLNGQLCDHKSTVVFMYLNKKNVPKFVLQGSIYRYMDDLRITSDTVQINYFFTDWSKIEAMTKPHYPQLRTISEKFPLLSKEETEKYIRDKLRLITLHEDSAEEDLPKCTDEDLWRESDVYKIYPTTEAAYDPTKKSTKNCATLEEAQQYVKAKGKGVVKLVKGKAKACNYCNAAPICSQRVALSEADQL